MIIKNTLLKIIIRLIFMGSLLLLGYVAVAQYIEANKMMGVTLLIWIFIYVQSHYVETYVLE